ncbi:MAG: hypothetical protein C0407_13525 [Desulfobacca sp.]|nr:hypothetical protein [Desulfobacca sp.]
MKKVSLFLIAFFLVGTGSLVLGQVHRGGRYNPYNPYLAPEHQKAQERIPQESNYYSNPYGALAPQTDSRMYNYERDYLTRSYITEYSKGFSQEAYFFNPYGTVPLRWYDTELGAVGGGSGRGFEIPGMLSRPFEETSLRQKQFDQSQGSFRERSSFDSDYTTIPYGANPRRWYDTPTTTQGTSQKYLESPKTLSSPYSAKEVRPPSSQVLTSPFENGFQQSPGTGSMDQELTPPVLR